MRHLRWRLVAGVLAVAAITATAAAGAFGGSGSGADQLSKINHFVVIYEENHSFDNLYGGWEGVNGVANADAAHTAQVNQAGNTYACLKQNDANLTAPVPLTTTCNDSTAGNTGGNFASHFPNTWFSIDDYIQPTDITCPPILQAFSYPNGIRKQGIDPATGLPVPNARPGGCTRDLVHRYYQEPYQLDGGKQDRYVTGSDAIGLTMGVYDTKALPVYEYLHDHPHSSYAVADDFFQAAFGGSYLNHQWLIAAATPVWTGALNNGTADDLHSVVDANGMPNNYPLYASPLGSSVRDTQLTQSCSPAATRPPMQPAYVCGDYTVNTTQPFNQPYQPGTAVTRRLPPLPSTDVTIGDTLTAAGVDWAWYAGGWSNAAGIVGGPGWTNGSGPNCIDPNRNMSASVVFPYCPDNLFQFHHQPFNYYANYAPGTPGRAHLQDEVSFEQLAASSDKKTCNLKQVSFVKPIGEENEHPGYASEPDGSDHLVDLLQSINSTACAKDTMVIVTYDEFGGQWDHVPPPGQGGASGPHDKWGPGTRIPALVVSPYLRGNEVIDHTQYDTTSILATLEQRYGLPALHTRDASVNSLANVFRAKQYQGS